MDKVLFVVPPFQSALAPALGASQLCSNLRESGFLAEVLYLNLTFAERIGLLAYEHISVGTTSLIGDFIFSHLLFEHDEVNLDGYVQEVLAGDEPAQNLRLQVAPGADMRHVLGDLIQAASEWVDESAETILSRKPWMVGFSSTFQQNCSSLALMKRIKQKRPELVTVMGGANCEDEMGEELFARFSQIDYLGQGECDQSLVELVGSLQNGGAGDDIQGFLARTSVAPPGDPTPLQSSDLESSPLPDFDDYFSQLAQSSFREDVLPVLVMETSRGCWWGAKQHCTFCGLNGGGLSYRSKSGPRVLEEMRALVERYGIDRISLVDNIMDMQYFKNLLPLLAQEPFAGLFYEIKANLTKPQVQLMANAGVSWVQPGIESLSDRSLRSMRKGVTELQNLQLLKWCAEVGTHVTWNHLFGFPGEGDEDAAQIARDAEALHHLEPPVKAIVLRMDRFSPNFDSPAEFGLERGEPAAPYRYVYPFPPASLRRLAYFFDSDSFLDKAKTDAFACLQSAMERWGEAHARSHLLALPGRSALLLIDTRACARRSWRRLTGLDRAVYECCDQVMSPAGIAKALAREGRQASPTEIAATLERFVEQKLMLEVGGRYLSLATDARSGYRRYAEPPVIGLARVPGMWTTLRASPRSPRATAGLFLRRSRRAWAQGRADVRLWALRLLVRGYAGSAGATERPRLAAR